MRPSSLHVALGAVLAGHISRFLLQVQSSAAGLLFGTRNVWIGEAEKAAKSWAPWLEVLDISEQCLTVPGSLLLVLGGKNPCKCPGNSGSWQSAA